MTTMHAEITHILTEQRLAALRAEAEMDRLARTAGRTRRSWRRLRTRTACVATA